MLGGQRDPCDAGIGDILLIVCAHRTMQFTPIEQTPHADWMATRSRISRDARGWTREVEPRFLWLSLAACAGNQRLRRPVKGSPLRGRAVLALDRPTRRLGDGYREMG